ncbi:MAG: S-adenosylmethionine:tRNA ribosyltransferase-isomerase, partial [Ottowia sp.]|nr:S-adenosylmethionine:tRNA ribosyltransferase-isomerase [Ottowia sp.]
MSSYSVSDFDYTLPAELIAQHPLPERSAARLLDGSGAQPVDRLVRDLPGLLRAGDVLVCNDTRVVRARLFGRKESGGALELLVERVLPDGSVAAHMRTSRKPRAGSVLEMEGGFTAQVLGRWPDAAGALFHLRFSGDAYELMQAHGHVPLPPYIERADEADDAARYQTVFARRPGAV